MSVDLLLSEISKEDYLNLTDAEIAAKLNEVQKVYVSCPAYVISEAMSIYSVHGRVEVLKDKGIIDDKIYTDWKQFIQLVELKSNVDPQWAESFINSLYDVGALGPNIPGFPPPLTRLLDMVTVTWTVSSTVYQRDVTEQNILDAKEMVALREKIEARRIQVDEEYNQKLAEISLAFEEMQKRDDSGNIIGDKDYITPWGK